MSREILAENQYGFLDNPIISNYFDLEEKTSYLKSLKIMNDKRNFYFEMIPCLTSFIELLKDEGNLKSLDKYIFKEINDVKLNVNEELINQAKRINKKGFDLMKIKDPLNFDTLKKSYLTAVKLHHPDIGGNTQDMQIINEAYSQFHKLIAFKIESRDNQKRIRYAKDYVYYAYIDLINILLDSWNIDGAYYCMKEAIENDIFNETFKDPYNYYECSLAISICGMLPDINFKDQAFELLEYSQTLVENIESAIKDYYIKSINKLIDNLENNKKTRVVINHMIQADNAVRLGIISKRKYNQYISKFNKAEVSKKETEEKLKIILSENSFIVPLANEEKIFKKLSNYRGGQLIPEPKYFQCDLRDLSKLQQWEYFKTFSERSSLALIRKYAFVRLYSYLNCIFECWDYELCIKITDEIKLIISIFRDNKSVQHYSNKILEALNILLNLDKETRAKRLDIIRKYSTIEDEALDTPINNRFMEFITMQIDEIEYIVNKQFS